jgi:hypothetical protein
MTIPSVGIGDIIDETWGDQVAAALNALIPTTWTNVTFQNGWVNYGAGQQNAQYRKIGDLVYLRGGIKSGTNGLAAFTLPVGFRPAGVVNLIGPGNTLGQAAHITITTAGAVNVSCEGGSTAFASLDGSVFSIA